MHKGENNHDEVINFIDTAYLYGFGRSEELIGEIITERGDRDRLVISTKASPDFKFVDGVMEIDNSRSALRQAVEDSLTRLQTDYLDMYFLHFPDTKTPLAELEFNTNHQLDVLQVQYNLLVRTAEAEIIPYCLENQISVIPYLSTCRRAACR
ncbi:aldo/keto reductase [Paenibacillus donghaensis]|uniref:aldo/keto reductase n=1 Tax=Paenibacillus donghaensis TaxID=414771 RepID=UPI001FE6BF6D|nr:aldo/keto reductase [Paenibacillus donghaensis]